MIKVKAIITLYAEGRTTPFYSGYRPLFTFVPEIKISGQITLFDREEFFPGQKAEVEIMFLNEKYLNFSLNTGVEFSFGEGLKTLGFGYVLRIM